jgi:hypothetical protein
MKSARLFVFFFPRKEKAQKKRLARTPVKSGDAVFAPPFARWFWAGGGLKRWDVIPVAGSYTMVRIAQLYLVAYA